MLLWICYVFVVIRVEFQRFVRKIHYKLLFYDYEIKLINAVQSWCNSINAQLCASAYYIIRVLNEYLHKQEHGEKSLPK